MNLLPPTFESIAFVFQHARGVGAAVLNKLLRRFALAHLSPADVYSMALDELQKNFGVPESCWELLHNPSDRLIETWDLLQRAHVNIFVRGLPGYPLRLESCLKDTAPPVLYWMGNKSLFDAPAIGFCGSRKASDKGLQVAADCSRLLAAKEIVAVSGYAHGVDLAAHKAALIEGGCTTIILAEGILHYKLKEVIKSVFDLSRVLIVSEFPPRLPWKAHSAMPRNRTICGMSDATIVIEAGLTGGTFEAGKTALSLGLPLFCIEFAEPTSSSEGNLKLLQTGAVALRRSRNGDPNLSQVLDSIHASSANKRAQQAFSFSELA